MNKVEAGFLGYQKSHEALSRKRLEQAAAAHRRHAEAARKCLHCRELVPYEARENLFCSKKCSIAARSRTRAPVAQKTNGSCQTCHAIVAKRQVYCSAHRPRPALEVLRTDAARRRYLLRKHGNACMICRNAVWLGQPIPIELDHIDGDPDNNVEANLRLVCPNCHAQTSTYKGKNKGKGRSFRRLRSVGSDVPGLYSGEAGASTAAGS